MADNEERSGGAGPVRPVRMRRASGGRQQVLYLRLSGEEDNEIRRRALNAGLSPQRYLVEAGMSGSAGSSSERRRAAADARATRVVLKGIATNLNQMTKWANANGAVPDGLDRLVDNLGRALSATERVALGFERSFTEPGDQDPDEVAS